MKRSKQFLNWSSVLLVLLFITATSKAQYSGSGNQTVCVGTHPYGVTNTLGSSYNWTITPAVAGNTISGSPTNLITVNWTVPGTYTLQVIETNGSGCVGDPVSIEVHVMPAPTVTVTSVTVCSGYVANISATANPGPASAYNYVWSVPSGVSDPGNVASFNSSVAGAYNVTITNSSYNSCAAYGSGTVTVNTLSSPTISGNTTICQNTTAVYTTESGMSGYVWTVSGGGTIIGSANNDNVTVSWTGTGSQTITVSYNNSFGCPPSAPTTQNITVNTLPAPTITGNTSICQNTTVVYNTETGMSGYVWTVSSGGTIIGSNNNDNVTVSWSGTGAQTISVTYNNANGCAPASPTVVNITVNTLPAPTITGNTTICENTTAVYTTEPGMTGYVWTVTGGTIIGSSNTDNVTVNWTGTGAQTISVTYNNANGCAPANPTVQNITVNPLPTASVVANGTICAGDNASFTITGTPGAVVTYNINGGLSQTVTLTGGTATITVNGATANQTLNLVSVSITATGCTQTLTGSATVTVNPKPVTSAITHN
jgi:hypothetical protein